MPKEPEHVGVRECSVAGCAQRHRARGLSLQHYDRLRYWRDPLADMYPMPTVCQLERCRKPVHVRGLCDAHYQRWRKVGALATND